MQKGKGLPTIPKWPEMRERILHLSAHGGRILEGLTLFRGKKSQDYEQSPGCRDLPPWVLFLSPKSRG